MPHAARLLLTCVWSKFGGLVVKGPGNAPCHASIKQVFADSCCHLQVCWERSGNYVAACFSNKTVAVINVGVSGQ